MRGSHAPETILLIDDSVTFREELKAALENASYRVVVAGSGEEGLRLAADVTASRRSSSTAYFPGSTARRLSGASGSMRRCEHCRAFCSPARTIAARKSASLDAGADAFVRKDDNIGVILARINAMLRSAGDQSVRRNTTSLLGPKKMLAVDDSETYLQELAEALRSEGYEMILARSGEEALELLAVQAVDCVLLDLMMPGIGGRETCRRVKSVPVMRDIPIIMLTAVEDREAMIQGLGAGADDYIAKSSDFDLVRARVLAQIRRKQFEDEHRHNPRAATSGRACRH